MSTTATLRPPAPTGTHGRTWTAPYCAALLVAAVGGLLLAPNILDGEPDPMMTHYMGAIAAHPPWGWTVFLAPAVILIYGVLVPASYRLIPERYGFAAALIMGVVYPAVAVYLIRWGFIPLSRGAAWRGAADVLAVTGYILAAVPAVKLALLALETGRLDKRTLAILFATIHVAMLAGMFPIMGEVAHVG